jgi:hypothetical protein
MASFIDRLDKLSYVQQHQNRLKGNTTHSDVWGISMSRADVWCGRIDYYVQDAL